MSDDIFISRKDFLDGWMFKAESFAITKTSFK